MNPLINSLMVRAADAPAIKPAVELGTPLLLTIAAIGIAVLLVMIIRFKIQAFVALLTDLESIRYTWTALILRSKIFVGKNLSSVTLSKYNAKV